MKQQRLRPFLKVFDDLALEVVDTEMTGSGHYRITVTCGGKNHFFIAPFSPSDRRAYLNFKSDVRRWQKSFYEGTI